MIASKTFMVYYCCQLKLQENSRMNKNSHLITRFAVLMIICMGVMLLYVWINYDDIRSEQRYRQIWHMNHKF